MMLESQKNIGDSILHLFPNAKVNVDFKVIHDGESFKLIEWNIPNQVPSLEELETVFEQAQEGRNIPPINELEVLKKQQADLVFQLMLSGVV